RPCRTRPWLPGNRRPIVRALAKSVRTPQRCPTEASCTIMERCSLSPILGDHAPQDKQDVCPPLRRCTPPPLGARPTWDGPASGVCVTPEALRASPTGGTPDLGRPFVGRDATWHELVVRDRTMFHTLLRYARAAHRT